MSDLSSFFGTVMEMVFSTAHAEAPAPASAHSGDALEKNEVGNPSSEQEDVDVSPPEDEEEEESSAGGDDDEEEEGEEPEDPAPAIRAECEKTKECAPAAHHFKACSDKVESGKGWHGEDCVEELFHLMHCVDACAAPKLFKRLV